MIMRKIRLGETKLQVSRLCYGTEPFTFKKGPPGEKTQGDISPNEGGRRLAEALGLGVNFWDTSDDYGTHPHVADALGRVKRREVVVADKTNAASKEEGWKAIENSLKALETQYVDIMFLHIVPAFKAKRSDTQGAPYISYPLKDRMGALNAFIEAKDTDQVRATALSTHSTKVLNEALEISEIDIVCTTLNIEGHYIDEGNIQKHLDALQTLKDEGKGVYVIKILSAGKLRDKAESAIRYALQFHEFIDAWNIGMYGVEDVKANIKLFHEVLN
jgi:aryl-alcohol dehydrogenase-like predicted oxidoreductase